MHALKVLHKVLYKSAVPIHARRLTAMYASVGSLLNGARLTVTALGRGLQSPARVKHNIKRMDRLLSNRHFRDDRQKLYRSLCHYLCSTQSRPVILVDWTDIVDRERLMLIRAALAVNGRAITLYETVYPLKHYNTPGTHVRFLQELKTLLPAACRPIIVTDAGFRGPWFRAVEASGWDWVGRIRNSVKYRLLTRQIWRNTRALYYRASSRIRYLGEADLSHKHPYRCHLYLYKKPRQGRRENRSIVHTVRHANSSYFRKQQRDPWLIATSLTPETASGNAVMRLYSKRMQIEECFRDLKSDRFGFGLSLSRSTRVDRLNNLLLIAALATLCLWWIGQAARSKEWQRHFQANTVRRTHVLAIPFLALAVISRQDYVLSMTELIEAKKNLLSYISEQNHV